MNKLTRDEGIVILNEFLKTEIVKFDWYNNIKDYIFGVVFYGSTAKGLNRPNSDLDILIFVPLETEKKYTKGEYFYNFMNREINIVIRSSERLKKLSLEKNNIFESEVFEDSEVLFQKNDLFKQQISILQEIKTNAINIFNDTRDIPYYCPEFINNIDNRCWGKHRILYKKFLELGFEVRYRVCSFKWSEQRIPEDIVKLAPTDLDYHLFLEIRINNKWVILDCSNDSKLPSYNVWNVKDDCKLAVNHNELLSVEKSIEFERDEKLNFKQNFNKYKEFNIKINKFFNKIRN